MLLLSRVLEELSIEKPLAKVVVGNVCKIFLIFLALQDFWLIAHKNICWQLQNSLL